MSVYFKGDRPDWSCSQWDIGDTLEAGNVDPGGILARVNVGMLGLFYGAATFWGKMGNQGLRLRLGCPNDKDKEWCMGVRGGCKLPVE